MSFEFEKSPMKKGNCPKCGDKHKGTFRYYIGLPREYGICDRKNNCGYHNKPGMEQLSTYNKNYPIEKKSSISIVYPTDEQLLCLTALDSIFHKFCIEILKIPEAHLRKWNVGQNSSYTVFGYTNIKNKVVNLISIEYLIVDNKDCKRNKKRNPFSLKAESGAKYKMCLYGEHLVTDKIICLVESEKTAVVASHFYPQYDWLATGGASKLTDEKIDVLFNKKIIYIGDSDKAGKENSALKKLEEYKLNYIIADLFPERNDGYDLADAIIEGRLPEINYKSTITNTEENFDSTENEPNSELQKNISNFEIVELYLNDRYEIRFNIVLCIIEYRKRGSSDHFELLNENDIFRELQHNFIKFSLANLMILLNSGFVKRYDPFLEYYESSDVWDINSEPDYIDKLSEFIPIKDIPDLNNKERFRRHLKKMLVRSVACSLTKTCNKQAFILVHEMQNSGKSFFCRWLCPPKLSDYIAENIGLDKDSQIALSSNFIINMDELATMNKTEINQLKSLMSKTAVKVRHPYGKKAITTQRRVNFFGNTNKTEFLADETGSVRWLCFELSDKINFNYSKEIDINDIWRQAYALFKSGFKYELTHEEIVENEIANSRYNITTLEQELIQLHLKPALKDDEGAVFLTPLAIKEKIEFAHPGQKTHIVNIGKALKLLNFKREQKFNGTYQIKGYYVLENFSL